MLTVCEREGAPQEVKEAIKRWYTKGFARLDEICKQMEGDNEK